MVETVDSAAHAQALESALARRSGGRRRLQVYLQVNTSGEQSKHGFAPADLVSEALAIEASCPSLDVQGLMTIGSIAASTAKDGPNREFRLLDELRAQLQARLSRTLELSMGMSEDFEQAVLPCACSSCHNPVDYNGQHQYPCGCAALRSPIEVSTYDVTM